MYGRMDNFVRVRCLKTGLTGDIAEVTWFSPPKYPDNDPLLVMIDLESEPPIDFPPFLFLSQVDPSPVMYELDGRNMFVMRLRGLDTNPLFPHSGINHLY